MVDSTYVSSGVTARRRFDSLSVEWFIFVIVAGGFLSYLQHTFLGRSLPIEIAIRALLAFQLAALLISGKARRQPLPGFLSLAIILFAASSVTSLVLSLLSG